MVPGYVVFGVFLVILYSLIWSGGCRLSCRHSALSDGGISGLSGLVDAYREEEARCICEACPCALIENFLISCRPATQVYTYTVGFLVSMIIAVYNTFYDAYRRIISVMQCGASCRRHAQLVDSDANSSENFTLVEEKPKMRVRPKPQTKNASTGPSASVATSAKTYDSEASKTSSSKTTQESLLSALKSSFTSAASSGLRSITPSPKEKTPEERSVSKQPSLPPHSSQTQHAPQPPKAPKPHKPAQSPQPSTPPKTQTISEETLKPKSSVDAKMNCSKCVETGKTCVGGCPNAEKHRKKK
ncbi:uncharacterized protein LOC113493368 isoform X2 [Trichoplusia ni]|uniref:Uncharacterized protein LOC113493368 isoform X2 n=1 Tax=Trichoplusia ni TaxID=7111 RepID=A0A7E5VFP9_TRINI|nr:uncharacterized protein LOC113493368 isoform X2 [Trichoplusia ni]